MLFGTSEEDVNKRVERILAVSGYEKDILGRVSQFCFEERLQDFEFRTIRISGYLGDFHFHKRVASNDQDADEVMYIASYRQAVDFEKELADIRVLLAETASKRLPCVFVMATNEDLSQHRSLLKKNFNTIKMSLPPKVRTSYRLEIWDAPSLRESEYTLRIKIKPKAPPKRKAKPAKSR